jgi:hypothetical protein
MKVAYVSGGVSYDRGGDADEWRPAAAGIPLAAGDRLYAARGASLGLGGAGFEIHLASATGLEAIDLTADVKRFYVWGRSASFLVRRLHPRESFRVDTPNAGVTFERPGEYRIDIDGRGSTNVVVDRGAASVSVRA